MGRLDHLIPKSNTEMQAVNQVDKEKNTINSIQERTNSIQERTNSIQERTNSIKEKSDTLKKFKDIFKDNTNISTQLTELGEDIASLTGSEFDAMILSHAELLISDITGSIDLYMGNLPSALDVQTTGTIKEVKQTQGGGMNEAFTPNLNQSENTTKLSTTEVGKKENIIDRMELYLNYLDLKGQNNHDLNSLIIEYRNYINGDFTPVDGSSKSIYEEIERSIKTITQKEQIEIQLISESKNKLKVLLSSLQGRLDKGEKNVIKNAIENFGDHSMFPEFWSYLGTYDLNEAMENIADIDNIDDIQKITELGEKIDVSTFLISFNTKKTDTLDRLQKDSSEKLDRDQLVKDLGLETKENFINQFNLLKKQLKIPSKVINLGDLGIVPFDSELERQQALVSTMMLMEAISKTPSNDLVMAYEAIFHLAEDGIDITNIGILDKIFVDLAGGGAPGELISGILGGVIIMYLMMKRNPFARLDAQGFVQEFKNKGDKKTDFQIRKEYFSLSEDKKEAFLEKHGDKLSFDTIAEIEDRKKVLDYVLSKNTKGSIRYKEIQKFGDKYLVMGGNPKVFYRLLNDLENYSQLGKLGDTYKNGMRLFQPARALEYWRKNKFKPEANLTKEQYLERANKSFINKIGKLDIDRSDDLMKIFDDELGEKPTNEKIKNISNSAKELNDAISKILKELNSTSKVKDTSVFENEIRDNLNKAIDDALNGTGDFDGKISDIIYDANELSEDIDKKLNSAQSIKSVNKKIDEINIATTKKDLLKVEIEKAYNSNKTPEFLLKADKIIESIQSIINASENDKLGNELKTAVGDKLGELLDNIKSISLLEGSINELQSEIDVLLGTNGNDGLIDRLSNLDASLQAKAYEKIKEGIKDERDVKITNIDQSVDNIIKVESTMRTNKVTLDFAKNIINDQLKETIGLPSGDFEILNNRLTKLAGLLDTVDSDFKVLLEKSVSGTNIDWSIMSKVDNLLSSFGKEKRFTQDVIQKGKLTQSNEVEKLAAKIEFLEGNGENVDSLKIKLSDLRKLKGLPDITPTPQPGPAPQPKPQPAPQPKPQPAPAPDVLVLNTDKLKDIIKNNPVLSGRSSMVNNRTSLLIKINNNETRIAFDLTDKNIDTILNKLENLKTAKDLNSLLNMGEIEERIIRPKTNPKLNKLLQKIEAQRLESMDFVERAKFELKLANIVDTNNSLDDFIQKQVINVVGSGNEIDVTAFHTLVGNRLQALGVPHIRETKVLIIEVAKNYDNLNPQQLAELQNLIASGNLKDIRSKFKGTNFVKKLLNSSVKKI